MGRIVVELSGAGTEGVEVPVQIGGKPFKQAEAGGTRSAVTPGGGDLGEVEDERSGREFVAVDLPAEQFAAMNAAQYAFDLRGVDPLVAEHGRCDGSQLDGTG